MSEEITNSLDLVGQKEKRKVGRPPGRKDTLETKRNKNTMISALEATLGVVTPALKKTGIPRATFYHWMNTDPEFVRRVDETAEVALDFAESSLHRQIQNEIPASTIFYLKTKGRKRGYTEDYDFRPDKVKNFKFSIVGIN